jgi:RNA polymerase sigma-70 factor (ECF subfamily)
MEQTAMERVEPGGAPADAELVARCRAGDESAFDELVLRHQARAVRIAYGLLRDHEDAHEVAQDAFVKVYENIGEFRGDCEFTTWLHQIVLNLARNRRRWWKRRRRDATVSLDGPAAGVAGAAPLQPAATTEGPDAEAAREEFMELLARKMDELPAKFREVLVLRNVENLSYEEISLVLGCSPGTVKSRIARAREALRKAMAGEL